MTLKLEDHLVSELGGTIDNGWFREILSEEELVADEEYLGQTFFLKYGIIKPVEDSVEKAVIGFYKSAGYAQIPHSFPENIPRDFQDELRAANDAVGTKNYSFVREKPRSWYVVTVGPVSEGILVSVTDRDAVDQKIQQKV